MKAEIRKDRCLHIIAETPTEEIALDAMFGNKLPEECMAKILIHCGSEADK